MQIEQAERTSLLLMSVSATLRRHLQQLEPHLERAELQALREEFELILGETADAAASIYRRFPQLRPAALDGPYPIEYVEIPEAMFARKAIPPSAEFD
ncbi:hypothetical protein ACI2IY_23065 [Lysobacter enzymogenes]|uniref:hypothetical protein n=1 Tax=Lysobacter enzymogenes TaxID=69 RepID=UPI00384A8E98